MRMRGAEANHVYGRAPGVRLPRRPFHSRPILPARKGGAMNKELSYVVKLAIVGAVVAVAVDYFVKPATAKAVKLR